jgi:hypothetical protein
MMDMLQELLNKAAEQLPRGYEINICVEKDAGWVDLYDPLGAKVDLCNSDEPFFAQVDLAIEAAIKDADENMG